MTTKSAEFARELREYSTDAERLFWSRVRAHRLHGYKFKRQHPIDRFIVDFACVEAKLIIELDGGQHVGSEQDKQRDARLKDEGYRVLRFWNNDVLLNIDGVIETVLKNLRTLSPALPHNGGGSRNQVLLVPSPVVGEG